MPDARIGRRSSQARQTPPASAEAPDRLATPTRQAATEARSRALARRNTEPSRALAPPSDGARSGRATPAQANRRRPAERVMPSGVENPTLTRSASWEASGRYGTASAEVTASALNTGVRTSGRARLTSDGLRVDGLAEARATLGEVSVRGEVAAPPVEVAGREIEIGASASGRALVGAVASASARVTATPDDFGVRANANALLGAQLVGSAQAGVGPVVVDATGTLSAGLGGSIGLTAEVSDGWLNVGATAGATVGLGGSGEVLASVDLERLAELV